MMKTIMMSMAYSTNLQGYELCTECVAKVQLFFQGFQLILVNIKKIVNFKKENRDPEKTT